MKVKMLFVLVILLGLFFQCEKNPSESKNEIEILVIEVSNSSFDGGYPGVWFSPSTGEIVAGGNENEDNIDTPPDENMFWIEPRDPEFANGYYEDQDIYGIKFIGIGTNYFEETTNSESGGFVSDLFQVGSFEINSVFYIRTEYGDCVIQILDWDQNDNYLKFKWKEIEK